MKISSGVEGTAYRSPCGLAVFKAPLCAHENAAMEHLQAAVEGVQTAQAQERLAQDAVVRTRRIRDEADNRLFQLVEQEEQASRSKRQRQDEAAVAATSATSSETVAASFEPAVMNR